MHRKIPLPRSWNRRAKSTVLQILALSHYTFTSLVARAANSRDRQARLRAEVDRLSQELALLQEELRIKDARMARLHAHRRPFTHRWSEWRSSSFALLGVGRPDRPQIASP